MDKSTALRGAGRAGGKAVQLSKFDDSWLIRLPDGTLLQEPPTPTYSCRICGGPIMVSVLSGGWSWRSKPPTYEAPWVHLHEEDWADDVHQARPVEIEPESPERAEQLASLDILGTDDLAEGEELTRRRLAIENPRVGLRFEHARMRTPMPGKRIDELPPEVCRVTRATSLVVYYRTGDGTGNRYYMDRQKFDEHVVGRVLPDQPKPQ